jgi:hypothetical protein
MKSSRIILIAILLTAMLCCWLSVLLLRQARSQVVERRAIVPHSLSVSPSRATVVGILADPNFRARIHAVEQRTGVETLAEPKVVVTSSSHAVNRMYYDERFTFYITNR